MTELTFGTGGDYSTLYGAWVSLPSTFTDDYTFTQVGDSVETQAHIISLHRHDRNGYSLTITGDLTKTITLGPTTTRLFLGGYQLASTTGDVLMEFCNLVFQNTAVVSTHDIWASLSGISTSYTFTFRYNKVFAPLFRLWYNDSELANLFRTYEFYGNHFEFDSIAGGLGTSLIMYTRSALPVLFDFYFEDNTLERTSSSLVGHLYKLSNSTASTYFQTRRNYVYGLNMEELNAPPGSENETYSSGNDLTVILNNRNHTKDTSNFVSVSVGIEGYYIPRFDSIMYIDATQDTNILANILGLNGLTVTHRAAGAYTPEENILSPINVDFEKIPNIGIKVTWTNTVQPAYPSTDIYFEDTPARSSFNVPKKIVGLGVEEWTFLYTELGGIDIQHLRLSHSASTPT